MKKSFHLLFFLATAAGVLSSCSTTRSLKEGQKLYTGANVTLRSQDSSKIKNEDLQTELEGLIRPKPNAKILGIPIKLMLFNAIGNPNKTTGFWAKLRNKVGEPPVTITEAALEKNRQVIGNRLENRGYFFNNVTLDSMTTEKKIKALYNAFIGDQYTFRNYTFTLDSSTIGKDIARLTYWLPRVRKDKPYSLETIKGDRIRIDDQLKQKGYYFFNPDYLVAYIDSTVGRHQVDADYRIKVGTPEKAVQPYRIHDIFVFADFDLTQDTSLLIDRANLAKSIDSTKHVHIIDPNNKFNPKVFDRTLAFKYQDLYNRKVHSLALSRLTNLDVFKFVRATFEEIDSMPEGNWLNAYYYLTPAQKKSIRFEVSGFVKSNNSNGAEVSVNWRNRNIFKGAEDFRVRAYGSLEQQLISGHSNIGTRKLGAEASLHIPRIVGPFKFIKSADAFLPKTTISLGFERFMRTDQYSLNSFNANYAYIWKPKLQTEHKLDVLNFVYVNASNIDPNFQLRLDTNIILRRSIEQQFILGSIYNFTYNSQSIPNYRKNNFYFNANVDVAGNVLGIVTKASAAKDEISHIFKIPFAQYLRGEIDFRHYMRISRTMTLASRIITGAGYAYGNSQTLPFVKSFFAGGPNDLRAFQIRSLGPGTYYAGNPRINKIYVGDQPAEMKIVLNTELRKKFGKYVEVAGFVDIGNTWLIHEDPTRPGGKISSSFLKEMTIGAGPGLRLDLSVLLLRLDIGIPLRGPQQNQGTIDWNFKHMNWPWFKENWVWNISLGYPF